MKIEARKKYESRSGHVVFIEYDETRKCFFDRVAKRVYRDDGRVVKSSGVVPQRSKFDIVGEWINEP